MISWDPIVLTFKLALITTCILLVIGIPLAYWLAFTRFKAKPFVETLISMPLVLPPTVLGFYLLIALGPNSILGAGLNNIFGIKLLFSFEGLVIASTLYSLPFMVHPIQAGFSNIPSHLKEASILLGKSTFTTLTKVLLPNCKPALITATVLSFAHTIGEFGVVLMIGGNIPNETRVASIAIYDEVEALNFAQAHRYSLILFSISFFMLLILFITNRSFLKSWRK